MYPRKEKERQAEAFMTVSELMQLHFYHILLIQAITKVNSRSRGRNIKPTSQCRNVNAVLKADTTHMSMQYGRDVDMVFWKIQSTTTSPVLLDSKLVSKKRESISKHRSSLF